MALGGSYTVQSQIALNQNGDLVRAYLYAQKAAAVYPFSRYHRQWRAIIGSSMDSIHPDLVIEDAMRSLRHDPYDGNVLSVVWFQALRKGDLPLAEEYLAKIEDVAADWPQMEEFYSIMAKVEAVADE